MVQVNIQFVFDEQKTNFDHFNELKTLILSTIPGLLYIYQAKKQHGASIQEGALICINTVCKLTHFCSTSICLLNP